MYYVNESPRKDSSINACVTCPLHAVAGEN